MLTSVARDFPNSRGISPSPHGGCWQCLTGCLTAWRLLLLTPHVKAPCVYSHLCKYTNLAPLLALCCAACLPWAPRGLQLGHQRQWEGQCCLGTVSSSVHFTKPFPSASGQGRDCPCSGPEPDGNGTLGEGPSWYNWWECEHS